MYRFSDPAPYNVGGLTSILPPTALNYGTFHSSDLDYWWQLIPTPTANQATLSDAMTAALSAFAHSGNPNTGSTVANWPASIPLRRVRFLILVIRFRTRMTRTPRTIAATGLGNRHRSTCKATATHSELSPL
jgi:carboxylesterase type B